MQPLEGGCLCGAVRYRVSEVFDSGLCHCRTCQRQTGSAALAWAMVPVSAFELLAGAPASYRHSGEGVRRFCGTCGVHLYFEFAPDVVLYSGAPGLPPLVTVNIGTLDDPGALPPRIHEWHESAVSWFETDDVLPRIPRGGALPHPAAREAAIRPTSLPGDIAGAAPDPAAEPAAQTPPTIVAMGGGGFAMEPDNPRLDDYLLSLARRRRARPRVLFVGSASGDSRNFIGRFRGAFLGKDCVTDVLPLFRRYHRDLEALVLSQDLIFVGGGNTANLLAMWRAHGLDRALRTAWQAGVVLAGVSAGGLCWFEDGVTDSWGSDPAPLGDGLGFLPGSFCPHYDGEPDRRPCYESLIAGGALPGGWAADDGVALHFEGTQLIEVVSSRPEAECWRVTRGQDGATEATAHPARLLP